MLVKRVSRGGDVHKTIQATFEIVTPMFLGGADQAASKISGSSFKGALSFWWRALNYARFVSENDGELDKALKAMQKEEQTLFGGPEGQGAFLLKITQPENLEIHPEGLVLNESVNKVVGVGARYLGYELMDAFTGQNTVAGRLKRSCLHAGLKFKVDFVIRPKNQNLVQSQLLPAIKLLGLLGALGSRTRRGWGSVALKSLTGDFGDWRGPESKAGYHTALGEILADQKTAMTNNCWPEGRNFKLSAFANESTVWITDKRCDQRRQTSDNLQASRFGADWKTGLEALDWMGRAMLNYRSYGRNGRVDSQSVQQQFVEDHNWFYNIEQQVDIPQRAAFGLPHNYFKYIPQGRYFSGSVNQGNGGRRGSPMFLHMHNAGNAYFGVVTILPNMFISGKIDVKRTEGSDVSAPYDLYTKSGLKDVSGLEVLLNFVGHGPNKYTPNKVLSFAKAHP